MVTLKTPIKPFTPHQPTSAHLVSRISLACLWYCVILMTTSWAIVDGRMFPMIAAEDKIVDKRSATSDVVMTSDYPDYQSGIRYDEYPVVVPKRTALLIDKVMVALQKALDEETKPPPPSKVDYSEKMDLQRRNQPKGRVYWRCYFNAVSCFKRK